MTGILWTVTFALIMGITLCWFMGISPDQVRAAVPL
jgi:hypothetical protein